MCKSVFALVAVLAVGGVLVTSDAFARGGGHGGGHFGGGHSGGGHFAGGHFGGHVAQFGGHGMRLGGAHGHFVRGHSRHFWHGRWWGYGVGPCWAWSDQDGEYVWICD